jgi:Fe2+ transport system protein B
MIKEYQVAAGVMAFSTTRRGGVSQGNYGEFNINEYCGDFAEHVAENRKRLAAELGVEELIEMLKETLPTDLPVVFISSVTGQGIQELKDVLWKELNSESNKLQEITAEDTLVHRDKDMSRFQQELAAEGEDVVEYIDEDEIEDVDDLDDFEYE